MMFRKTMYAITIAGALVPVLAHTTPAHAHNAGHIMLPSGECLNVGGGNSVVLPDTARAYTNATSELDLIPGTSGDEIGARFAAQQGNSRVEPHFCP